MTKARPSRHYFRPPAALEYRLVVAMGAVVLAVGAPGDRQAGPPSAPVMTRASDNQVRAFLATVQQGTGGTFSTSYSVVVSGHREQVYGAQLSHSVTMYRETPAFEDFVEAISARAASFEVFEVFPGGQHAAGVGDGLYSCTQRTTAGRWACQGPYVGIGMGETFSLTAPYPPTELARGLANAAYAHLHLGGVPPAPAENAYFFNREILGHDRLCLGFGSTRHLVGSTCLGPGRVVSYYDLPATVTWDTYRSASLVRYSNDVTHSVFQLPTPPVAVRATSYK
jgi:hypothetical protein